MKFFLVTSNKNKAADILKIFDEFGFKVEWIKFDAPEIQDTKIEKIVKQKAKLCSKLFKKNVIVADAGLFIDSLNGFPGAMVKWVLKTIGNKGILKLMEGKKNRRARFIEAIGFCAFNSTPKSFVGVTEGKITNKILDKKGFGFDPIFRPKGYRRTYGQDPELRIKTTPLRKAIKKFIVYVKK